MPDPWTTYEHLLRRDPASLTGDERLLLAFGELRADVNSGGFDFYFQYRQNATIAIEAAREADSHALAALVEEAIALVGNEILLLDDEGALSDRLEHVARDLAKLDQRFYDLEATVDLDAAMSRLEVRAVPITIPARQKKFRWRR